MKGRADLTADNMPPFVWLSDPADPNSAQSVKPSDLQSTIGDAARLVYAQVEMTDDPVVLDIGQRLPWYESYRASRVKEGVASPDDSTLGSVQLVATGSME